MGVLLSLLQLVFAYVKGQEDSTYPLQMVRFPLPQLGALGNSRKKSVWKHIKELNHGGGSGVGVRGHI